MGLIELVFTAAAHEIKLQIRAHYGSLRVRILKWENHSHCQEREPVVADGVTDMSNRQIEGMQGISGAPLYRIMKRGNKFEP